MDRYFAVMIGAAAGGLARYIMWTTITQRFSTRFPLGTLVVNVSGCFVIGVLMPLLTEKLPDHHNLRLLLVTGVLGGYTTFSSFAWETYANVRQGSFGIGFANVALSVILGYLGVWLGAILTRVAK